MVRRLFQNSSLKSGSISGQNLLKFLILAQKTDSILETKIDSILETKTDSILETKTDSILETKIESILGTKTDSILETKIESILETKTKPIYSSWHYLRRLRLTVCYKMADVEVSRHHS